MKMIEGGVTAALGFAAGGVHCGIRKNKSKPDLAMIHSDRPCAAAAVYTQNLVKGAPILVTQKNIADGFAQAVICNSGNANTCNADGLEKAEKMCELAAAALGLQPSDMVVASTGVIGQVLPIEPIESGIPELVKSLSDTGSTAAATAIMTTDTQAKEAAVEVEIGGKTVKIGGISKGSGMIHPNMATMLSFVTTDCANHPPDAAKGRLPGDGGDLQHDLRGRGTPPPTTPSPCWQTAPRKTRRSPGRARTMTLSSPAWRPCAAALPRRWRGTGKGPPSSWCARSPGRWTGTWPAPCPKG